MNFDMKKWIQDMIRADVKKPLPVLSFPGIQITGNTVEEIVGSGKLQADCMEAIAKKFDMAAVLSLMDLSVEAEAFGSPVRYSAEEVPTVTAPIIHDEDEAEALRIPEVGEGRTGECLKGIQEIAGRVKDRPILAGMIGPYSLAGRLLDMTEIMILCYEDPELVETVLEKVTQFLCAYARAFKAAGADGIVLAEPAAGLLGPGLFRDFSVPYVKQICEAAEEEGLILLYHNCGTVEPLLADIAGIPAAGYSFGNAVNMETVLKAMPDRKYRSCGRPEKRKPGYDPQRDTGADAEVLRISEFHHCQRMRHSADDTDRKPAGILRCCRRVLSDGEDTRLYRR